MVEEFKKRLVAYKVSLASILNKPFVKEDLSSGFSFGFVEVGSKKVSRVNIIGTVVDKSSQGFSYAGIVLDDGGARMAVRSFGEQEMFSGVEVGDLVVAIGKIREFNGEKYVLSEIVKRLDNLKWLELRKLELEKSNIEEIGKQEQLTTERSDVEDVDLSFGGINDKIYDLIREFDKGEGAETSQIIRNLKDEDGQKAVDYLLMSGNIFEITPGRVKLLERID